MPAARLAVIAGAGHMGPLTHASEVNAAIARHIAEAEAHGCTISRSRLDDRFNVPYPTTHAQRAKGLI